MTEEYRSVAKPKGKPDKKRFSTAKEFVALREELEKTTEKELSRLERAKRRSVQRASMHVLD